MPATTPTRPALPAAAALSYAAHRRAVRAAVLEAHRPQALKLRDAIRAKWLARAAAGDADAVLYLLAQGW